MNSGLVSDDEFDSHPKFHLFWEILIFVAAVASVAAITIELAVHVSHETERFLRIIDFTAICLFSVDLVWKYKVYWHHATSRLYFIEHNWLDVLAIIPIFRVFRIGRFARLSRLAKLGKTVKAVKAGEKVVFAGEKAAAVGEKILVSGEKTLAAVEKGYKGVSGYAHGLHGKHALKDLKNLKE
ncbi:MAG TPA: ion transporter [Candidatus Altiarchaeales archaeon]|nr:ion transporter [Candidatus Altiarchaeales archaeon]